MRIRISDDFSTDRFRIGPTVLIGIVLFIASSYFITFKDEPNKWLIGLFISIPVLLTLRIVKRRNLKNYRRLFMEDDYLLIEERETERKIPYSAIYAVACGRKSLYGIAKVIMYSGEVFRFSVRSAKKDRVLHVPGVITELRKRVNSNQALETIGTSFVDPDRLS